MILVSVEWKSCTTCGWVKPVEDFWVKSRDEQGKPVRWQSACKPCHRSRQRVLNGYEARKPPPNRTPEELAEMKRQNRRDRMERIRADPMLLAEWRERKRMEAWGARERARQGGPKREYPLRRIFAGEPVANAHKQPSQFEMVKAAPLREFLLRRYPGWEREELQAHLNGAVSNHGLLKVLTADQVTLDLADRLLTLGLDRPDLLNTIYPMET
jgi:hypothetical protein